MNYSRPQTDYKQRWDRWASVHQAGLPTTLYIWLCAQPTRVSRSNLRPRNSYHSSSSTNKTLSLFGGSLFASHYHIIWPPTIGFPGGTSGKEPSCQCGRCKRRGFVTWVGKIPWRRKWQLNPIFLPGKFHGQRSLAGYSLWSRKRVGHDLAYSPIIWPDSTRFFCDPHNNPLR